MEQNPLQDKFADDLCNPIVIVVIFCHIIAIFLNPRKCIAHHSTYMGSLEHFDIILCISGSHRVLNRDSKIVAHPADSFSLRYRLWYDLKISGIGEKASHGVRISLKNLLLKFLRSAPVLVYREELLWMLNYGLFRIFYKFIRQILYLRILPEQFTVLYRQDRLI